mgnify:CR=1 FL=1
MDLMAWLDPQVLVDSIYRAARHETQLDKVSRGIWNSNREMPIKTRIRKTNHRYIIVRENPTNAVNFQPVPVLPDTRNYYMYILR